MDRHGCRIVVAAMLAVAAAGSHPASADHGATGVLNAVALRPLPKGLPILVRPLDDTEENLAIKARIEASLASRGFVVGDDPTGIVLSFESHSEESYRKGTPRRTFVELGGRKGAYTGPKRAGTGGGAKGMLKLFDSQKGAVFNEVDRGIEEPVETLFRLNVDISDRRDGKAVWMARAVANLRDGAPIALAKALVPAIVDNMGRTAKEETLTLLPPHER